MKGPGLFIGTAVKANILHSSLTYSLFFNKRRHFVSLRSVIPRQNIIVYVLKINRVALKSHESFSWAKRRAVSRSKELTVQCTHADDKSAAIQRMARPRLGERLRDGRTGDPVRNEMCLVWEGGWEGTWRYTIHLLLNLYWRPSGHQHCASHGSVISEEWKDNEC